jgi:hypothetical protein
MRVVHPAEQGQDPAPRPTHYDRRVASLPRTGLIKPRERGQCNAGVASREVATMQVRRDRGGLCTHPIPPSGPGKPRRLHQCRVAGRRDRRHAKPPDNQHP